MTNATSTSNEEIQSQPEYQPRREEETQRIVEAVRGCLQISLAGEAQNFRSWVAATHKKSKGLQRMAMAITAFTCLFSTFILMASIWEVRRITHQAEAQLQFFQKQAAAGPDVFAELRRENLEPAGKPILQKGRTFIELKSAK